MLPNQTFRAEKFLSSVESTVVNLNVYIYNLITTQLLKLYVVAFYQKCQRNSPRNERNNSLMAFLYVRETRSCSRKAPWVISKFRVIDACFTFIYLSSDSQQLGAATPVRQTALRNNRISRSLGGSTLGARDGVCLFCCRAVAVYHRWVIWSSTGMLKLSWLLSKSSTFRRRTIVGTSQTGTRVETPKIQNKPCVKTSFEICIRSIFCGEHGANSLASSMNELARGCSFISINVAQGGSSKNTLRRSVQSIPTKWADSASKASSLWTVWDDSVHSTTVSSETFLSHIDGPWSLSQSTSIKAWV